MDTALFFFPLGVLFVGVLVTRALIFGVYIGATVFWETLSRAMYRIDIGSYTDHFMAPTEVPF